MRTIAAAVTGVFLVSACGSGAEPSTASDDIQTARVIGPIDFLHCWVTPDTSTTDAFFQRHAFTCKRPESGDYPLSPETISVEVQTARQNASHADVTTKDTVIARISNDDLPLKVYAKLRFNKTTSCGDMFGLKEEREVVDLASASEAAPLVYKSPFSLWGISVTSQEPDLFAYASYKVPTGTFKVGYNFSLPDTDTSELDINPLVEGNGRIELALIVPPSGKVDLKVNDVGATITKPGAFVFDGHTLRADGTAPAPTPDPNQEPTTTCGGEGQARCPNGACVPSHRFDGKVCKACGRDGQTYCTSQSGARICDPEHRLDGATCRACGADGQTYCLSKNGGRVCNEAHRLNANTCRACGADGQTYCLSQTGTKLCNSAHRLDGATCRACGDEGQTYCLSQLGSRICNAGLHVAGNTCTR